MNNFELYLTTCQKFKNDFIPQLPDIIYISLIDDKEKKIDTLNEDISKKKKTFIKLEQEMKGLKVNEEEKEEEIEFLDL